MAWITQKADRLGLTLRAARLLSLTGFFLWACAEPKAAARVEPGSLWVDGSAAVLGDGSFAAPFKTLGEALARAPARIEIRAGLYRGPFILPGGTELVGHGAAVLYGEGEDTVPVSYTHLTLPTNREV